MTTEANPQLRDCAQCPAAPHCETKPCWPVDTETKRHIDLDHGGWSDEEILTFARRLWPEATAETIKTSYWSHPLHFKTDSYLVIEYVPQ